MYCMIQCLEKHALEIHKNRKMPSPPFCKRRGEEDFYSFLFVALVGTTVVEGVLAPHNVMFTIRRE